jgi:hypothetical protein
MAWIAGAMMALAIAASTQMSFPWYAPVGVGTAFFCGRQQAYAGSQKRSASSLGGVTWSTRYQFKERC